MTMTISEALKDAEWMIQSAYEMGVHELGYDPMAVIRSRLEADDADLSTVYALGRYDGKRLEVTDEMVERACIAMFEDWNKFHQFERENFRKLMKAALVAALGDGHDSA